MADPSGRKVTRRGFLKGAAVASAAGAVAAGSYWLGGQARVSRAAGTKVIVIGLDGMDPGLCEAMMRQGQLPNLTRLRAAGGFSRLGTSIPPQSPVAWANFINGAGPGSHGIFDFVHRHPHDPRQLFYAGAETVPGEGAWEVGEHRLPLDFWPFNHQPTTTVLRRQGVPFWDFLDEAGVPSTFYDLPCNYPPSPSHHGHHRCLAGMGTPDMVGGYGTYQHFSEDGPDPAEEGSGGRRSRLTFDNDTARASIVGPPEPLLQQPRPILADFMVHRDRRANAAVIQIKDRRIVLRAGAWSRWVKLDFEIDRPWFLPRPVPGGSVSGICRFYLQEVSPTFRLYVSPINFDPSAPATKLSEPESFVTDVSEHCGLFHTTGFKEDHSARRDRVFTDDEFLRQATHVLEERLALFEHAVNNYDDGLLFFYFSSSDLQSHIFWWDNDDPHPVRTPEEARAQFGHVRRLYRRIDRVVGDVLDRYGSQATVIVMSDHGFANFGTQFNLNTWLRGQGYLGPPDCTSVLGNIDWAQTRAYGLGINGLYVNLKGREPHGTVEPGDEYEAILDDLKERLEAVRDEEGRQVVRQAYRADRVYQGGATALAPDLIVGYARGFRVSWESTQGNITDEVLSPNEDAWSADHCMDALEVPGVLYSNRPLRHPTPALVDLAPSILAEFGLATPSSMVGRNIFG